MARKTKKFKRPPYRKALSRQFLSVSAFLSLTIFAFLAFVSIEAAFITLGFLALSAALYYEKNQRRFWEQAASFKFKQIKEEQKRFSRELSLYRFDLDVTKDEVDVLADRPLKTENQTQGFEKKTMTKKMKFATRPVKKVKTPPAVQSPVPVNYDPLADYDALSDMVVKELVHNAVNNKQVDVFIQPIMRLPQRQTRFYEIFARIRAKPGMYLPASRYIKLAREDQLMHRIDHLLLMQCLKSIQDSAQKDNTVPFFINITSTTLTNALFMKQLLTFLSKNRDMAPQLVFEIQQADFNAIQPAILEILRGLGHLGCSLSIDHVQNLEFDIKFLQVLKVRFVKINASALLEQSRTGQNFTKMNQLKRKLEGNGIGFIVEKIEDEKTLTEILDFDIHYGQGYLFGRPDLQGVYQRVG